MARLPDPPGVYDKAYMEQLISRIDAKIRTVQIEAHLRGADLNLALLPTSAAGLRSGDVWKDVAAGNVLKIVP